MGINLDEYKKIGAVKIANVFESEEIESIYDEVDKISTRAIGLPTGSYVNFADKDKKVINSIHRIEEMDSSLNNYANSPKILSIAEDILGKGPELFSIQLFLKPANKGLATPAHQDNAFWHLSEPNGITFWVALDHVDETNGAVQFIPGSHDRGLVEHVKSSDTPGSSRIIRGDDLDGENWISFELKPGDCTVHGGWSIHRSGVNVSGRSRRALLFNFKARNAVRDENAFNEYNRKLEKIHGR